MLSIARPQLFLAAAAAVAVATLAAAGCTQLSPAEQVEAARAQTTVELRSFAVREQPVAEPATEAAEGETDAEADGEEGEAMPADVPVDREIDFDLLISSEADEPLDGITVELEQVDSARNPKAARRIWVETPGLMRAVGAQFTVTVDDLEYVEGDGFTVTVRTPVPEAERSEYREFQGLGDS